MPVVLKLVAGVAGIGLVAATAAAFIPAPAYERDIQSIFTDNCVACHQTGMTPDGLNLEEGQSFGHLVGKRSAHAPMSLVEAGSPDKSYLVAKLEGTHLRAGGHGERMPMGGMLPASDITEIRRWISAGAKP